MSRPTIRSSLRPLLALALAFPLLASAGASAPQAAPSDADLLWLRVEVTQYDGRGANVKISVPLSLVEVMIDSLDRESLLGSIDHDHGSIDIQNLWRAVRDMDAEEILTVETDGESVKVWKSGGFFRVDVHEGRKGAEVEIQVPLELMDYLFDAHRDSFDFQGLVERMRDYAPLMLVRVESEHETVKIWIEEE